MPFSSLKILHGQEDGKRIPQKHSHNAELSEYSETRLIMSPLTQILIPSTKEVQYIRFSFVDLSYYLLCFCHQSLAKTISRFLACDDWQNTSKKS